jgi:hypothetical protein
LAPEGCILGLIKTPLKPGLSTIISSILCSASRFVVMYRSGIKGRNMSSAEMNMNGRGVSTVELGLGWLDKNASQTRKASRTKFQLRKLTCNFKVQ